MPKDFKEKGFPYSEFDMQEILDKLLEKGLIELLESKHPEQIERTNDPRYYKYYMIGSHCWMIICCILRAPLRNFNSYNNIIFRLFTCVYLLL